MSRALLPSWHGPAEAALADTGADLVGLPVAVALLWNPATCPLPLLPWLAWALDAADFDPTDPEETQRRAVGEAILIHRERGTPAGVRRALAASGFGTATIYERYGVNILDGSLTLDGGWTLTPADHWAEYRVVLDRPIALAQADRVRAIIARGAPAHAHLKTLDFRAAAMVLDGAWSLDGTYSLGEA